MSRNPYHSEGKEPTLQRSVLAYMDILGYGAMTQESTSQGTQEQLLRKLHHALGKSREQIDPKDWQLVLSEKYSYAIKAFTDNIVLGHPVRDDARHELSSTLQTLAMFQLDMSNEGFFIRGAISVGDAYVDDIVVLGNALIEAHDGETKFARDPRIILTNSAVEAAKEHLSKYPDEPYLPHVSDILCDSNGQWFLNYLECVLIATDEHGPFYDEFSKHKTVVEEKLHEHGGNPLIWSKYAWVANYHNYFCDLHPEYFDSIHKIDVELFRSTPKLIMDHLGISRASP